LRGLSPRRTHLSSRGRKLNALALDYDGTTEFVDVLGRTESECLHGHLQRGDFSRWIAGVFGDRPLASTIRRLEDYYRLNRVPGMNDAIIQAILSRYEFTSES
jgi:hypothetical protein